MSKIAKYITNLMHYFCLFISSLYWCIFKGKFKYPSVLPYGPVIVQGVCGKIRKSHGKWLLFFRPGKVMEFVKKGQKSWIFFFFLNTDFDYQNA